MRSCVWVEEANDLLSMFEGDRCLCSARCEIRQRNVVVIGPDQRDLSHEFTFSFISKMDETNTLSTVTATRDGKGGWLVSIKTMRLNP